MGMYDHAKLDIHIYNMVKNDGEDVAIEIVLDWLDMLDEMAAAGLNTADLCHILTASVNRLGLRHKFLALKAKENEPNQSEPVTV